ncbi:C-C motif chemokine 4 isoform X5 [Theropithecus gelada]|uniref:C-C motif chemokine 4 isoform X5 n=1 Tax=Theropithecus gelada TaxID=9565 RepID=UPI000DC1B137|nr:C-C motif chemokine 4 isoform X5 [Theropithecus gelada]
MKLCVTVLSLLVLVAAFCSPALSAPMGSDPPTSCCFSYTVRKLPRNFVVDYYETSSLCSQPAVVAAHMDHGQAEEDADHRKG